MIRSECAERFDFYQLVAGADVVVKQLEDPEAGVGFAVVPVDHGNAGELGRETH